MLLFRVMFEFIIIILMSLWFDIDILINILMFKAFTPFKLLECDVRGPTCREARWLM